MYAYKAYLPSLTINKDNVNRLNKNNNTDCTKI